MANYKKIKWSPDLAYAVGLITADGYLRKDGSHIHFNSKDNELVKKFSNALSLKNKITKRQEGKRVVMHIVRK